MDNTVAEFLRSVGFQCASDYASKAESTKSYVVYYKEKHNKYIKVEDISSSSLSKKEIINIVKNVNMDVASSIILDSNIQVTLKPDEIIAILKCIFQMDHVKIMLVGYFIVMGPIAYFNESISKDLTYVAKHDDLDYEIQKLKESEMDTEKKQIYHELLKLKMRNKPITRDLSDRLDKIDKIRVDEEIRKKLNVEERRYYLIEKRYTWVRSMRNKK